MSNKETLNFNVGLSRSGLKKQPEFTISINDIEYVKSSVSADPNNIEYYKFEAEVFEGDCVLTIHFLNKTDEDTVKGDNGEIVDDVLLNIESIEVDDIQLGNLLWTQSDYRPNYPTSYVEYCATQEVKLEETIKNCVNLGWNGRWSLSFQSPYFIWLLENI